MPDKFVLVHGTFAYDEFDDVPDPGVESSVERIGRWWQFGSKFATYITQTTGVSGPVKQKYSTFDDLMPGLKHLERLISPDHTLEPRVFHWS